MQKLSSALEASGSWERVRRATALLYGLADNETLASVERSDPERLSRRDWTLDSHGDRFIAFMRALGNGSVADHFTAVFAAAREAGMTRFDHAVTAPLPKAAPLPPRSAQAILCDLGVPERYAREAGENPTHPWDVERDRAAYDAAVRWAKRITAADAGGNTVNGLLLYSVADPRRNYTGNGTGKTSMAASLFAAMTVDRARSLRPYEPLRKVGYWANETNLFELLRADYNFDQKDPDGSGNEESLRMQHLMSVGVLAVDDVGKAKVSPWVIDRWNLLFESREGPTIITSNLSPKQLGNVYGTAVASRLSDRFRKLEFTAADWRSEHAVA